MIGHTIGHYKILDKLGEGGMGEVYRAEDMKLGRRVALKVLPPEMAEDPERLQRFEQEARTVAALNHPNIVTLYAVEEAEGLNFITMELVQGHRLTELITEEGLAVERLLELAIPLADAVAAAHRNGVIHRDLKPDNVMIDDEGRLKVLDFGLAKLDPAAQVDSDTMVTLQAAVTIEGSILGTVAYMSPEQAQGKPIDPRSDVFSLGILLYEMATGRRPFQGDNNLSVLTSILHATPRPISDSSPGLPQRLDEIVRHCLGKEPTERYDDAGELREDLKRLSAGVRPLASDLAATKIEETETTQPAPSAPTRRSWYWPLVLAAAIVILLVGSGWLFWNRTQNHGRDEASGIDEPYWKLAVLPFDNFTDDPGLDQVALGIPEEILARMAKGWGVVARNTSFAHKGEVVCEAASMMQARFIMEGSVRQAEDLLRITAQVIDCPSGDQVWAETYDREAGDAFALQDDIAGRISSTVFQVLSSWRGAESPWAGELNAPENPMWYLKRRSKSDNATALTLVHEAIERDPADLSGYLMLNSVHLQALLEGWAESPAQSIAEMDRAAQECFILKPQSMGCQAIAGNAYLVSGQRDKMIRAFQRAVDLSGGAAGTHGWLGGALAVASQSDAAIASIEEALQLNPEHNDLWIWHGNLAVAHFAAERYEMGRDSAQQSIHYSFNNFLDWQATFYQVLAASYAHLDQPEEARAALEEAMRLRPGLTTDWVSVFMSTSDPEHRDRYLEGLRLAGLED